jgi:hypothetical protein
MMKKMYLRWWASGGGSEVATGWIPFLSRSAVFLYLSHSIQQKFHLLSEISTVILCLFKLFSLAQIVARIGGKSTDSRALQSVDQLMLNPLGMQEQPFFERSCASAHDFLHEILCVSDNAMFQILLRDQRGG